MRLQRRLITRFIGSAIMQVMHFMAAAVATYTQTSAVLQHLI